MSGVPAKFQAAIAKYESAREALQAFSAEHARIVEEYNELREAHNRAIAGVKAEYQKNFEKIGKNYGDFKAVTKTRVDGELLLELLGTAADPIVTIKQQYSVDRKIFDKAVEEGIISEEVIEKVVTTDPKPSIYTPDLA